MTKIEKSPEMTLPETVENIMYALGGSPWEHTDSGSIQDSLERIATALENLVGAVRGPDELTLVSVLGNAARHVGEKALDASGTVHQGLESIEKRLGLIEQSIDAINT